MFKRLLVRHCLKYIYVFVYAEWTRLIRDDNVDVPRPYVRKKLQKREG